MRYALENDRSLRLRANQTSTSMRPILGTGQPGQPGQPGLPGVNAIPADEAVAAYATTDGAATKTALEGSFVSVTEAPLNARRYGALNDGSTDDSAAYQAAINALPGDINAGGGAIIIDGQTVWNEPVEILDKAGVKFVSPGGFQSYISPGPGVAASGQPLIKVAASGSIVRGFQMENVNIDMVGANAHAIEIAGAFDNTELRNVWVRGVHRDKSAYRFIPASTGDGISQSIVLINVQGIRIDAATGTGAACTAPMFYAEGVHEIVGVLTKAISSGQSVGGIGYQLVDCWNVTLEQPSASNLEDSFRITSSGGGHVSQAITLREPYLETVERGAVVVGASEAEPVLKVSIIKPNVNNPAGSPLVSVFDGTHARLCELDIYDEPVVFNTGAYMNTVHCVVRAVTDNSGSGLNEVRTSPNGLGEGTNFNGHLRVAGVGAAPGVDQTQLWVSFNPYGGPAEWRRVKADGPDSGGVGFRRLVIPN